MEGLEITVLLGSTVLVGAVLAPRVRVAAPLLLLVAGLLLGFVPELRGIQLPPETMLLLFLPVMLFWESLTTSLRAIKRDLRGIALMSTLLVVATAFGVAAIAHLFGLPWQAGLILGAAVAPPDATAVAALGRTLPRYNFTLLKAESLTNDGTALVVYAIAVGVAVGGSFTPMQITGMVLLSYGGGIAVGAVIGAVSCLIMNRLRDPMTINIALLLTPFTAYLVAELIGASGVLAVVTAGLIVTYFSQQTSTAASRRQAEWMWPLGTFLLNGTLFVLIGLEVQAVIRQIDPGELGRLLLVTVAVWVALVVVRFVFETVSVMLIRLIDRRPSQRARRMSHRARVVSAFAGFRGAVSLTIALSVPLVTDAGVPLAGRDEIVFVTAGVIVLTLLVQGPLLPPIVRWARLPDDETESEELRLAECSITQAAVAAVDTLANQHGISDEVRQRLTRDYTKQIELLTVEPDPVRAADRAGAGTDRAFADPRRADDASTLIGSPLARHDEYVRLRLAILEQQRQVLNQLRREGTVDDVVARRIHTLLDVEELRLTGVEPLD